MNAKYLNIFEVNGLNFGRMLSYSKSLYRENHPNDNIVFNARIYIKKVYDSKKEQVEDFFKGQEIEVWYGDLNVTKDLGALKKIQKEINETLVITTEQGNKVKEVG